MVFVIRVRDPGGMHRLLFPNQQATWAQLQQQVEDVTKLPIDSQLLSRTPLHIPSYIECPPNRRLDELKLANGDILYLAGHTEQTLQAARAKPAPNTASAASTSSSAPNTFQPHIPSHTLTPRCQHGPRGACAHCLGVEPGRENEALKGKCTHGPNATCIHCAETVKKESKDLPVWLCTHPDTVFCPKCIPAESEEEKAASKSLACSCDRSKGQECSRCVSVGPTIKVDKIPFARYLDDKRAMCKFRHSSNTTCAMCIPPALPSFTGKKNCDKGHQPWPAGVCLSCAPANATIREQPYRHCDTISIEPQILQSFYQNWCRTGSTFQRAAILFGTYSDESAETNNPGAVRANVYALYEPPQENAKDFVRFLKDPHESTMHEVVRRLGLDVVGWVVATMPREGEKYGGKVFMSGLEVQQAARFQNRYKDAHGYSKFVTVVLEHGEHVEPRAYQVSDLAVCLERDGVFAKAGDSNMLATRIPNAHEMVPTVVYKDRPLLPGKEFLPDELLVKVITSAPPVGTQPFFAHTDFPPLPTGPTESHLKQYMQRYVKEGYERKLADFNLLCFLHAKKTLTDRVFNEVCKAIASKKSMSQETQTQLDTVFLKYMM